MGIGKAAGLQGLKRGPALAPREVGQQVVLVMGHLDTALDI
jgi:hypothetical protein